MFDTLVNSQTDLTADQKFTYLLSYLAAVPRRLIQNLNINNDSDPIMRNLLERRYQNTRRVAVSFFSEILNLPNIAGPKSRLRINFLNSFLVATKSLERLRLPIGEWSYLFFQIATVKLHTELKTRFKQRYGSDLRVLPTFYQLVEFLEEENQLFDSIPCHKLTSCGQFYNKNPDKRMVFITKRIVLHLSRVIFHDMIRRTKQLRTLPGSTAHQCTPQARVPVTPVQEADPLRPVYRSDSCL
ncbi:hypothetical protein EVAR_55098_1 [Eumeta japonica]|uniref:Uncharacterized protein n=1 Tax=Eumeta variegata TaxID=151549 RepID=A0A4C1YFJ4_EUMVA|nr:hypothetical protein EVAR_55098_1 [Eumeta japonica]